MKKSNLLLASLAILFSSMQVSCHIMSVKGNGNVITKEIAISDYQKLVVEGGNIELTYTQSEEAPYLQIETDENILDILKTSVNGDELKIRPLNKRTAIEPTRFVIKTNSKNLKDLKMAGSGEGRIEGLLKSNELELGIAGSGSLSADSLDVYDLECDIAGSGEMILAGKAEKTTIKSAGSCNVRAFDLTTERLECKMAGSNNVDITVNKEISAKIAGSGELKYKGNPKDVHSSTAGSGSVTRVE
jgi:Putative auto-transporter adhesin, head GIN domain